MRSCLILLVALGLPGCADAPSSSSGPPDFAAPDLASSADLAMCSSYQEPTCCPGVCTQDDCCDPACLGALEGVPCTPGLTCTYDQTNALQGTFNCGIDGKLHCQGDSCADLGL